MQKYTHIIWDWNGTLKNDAKICMDITNDLLQQRKKPALTLETYQKYFNFPVKGYYEKIGLDFASEPFEALANEFMANYDKRSEECKLQSNAALVVKEFAEKAISQSVLSARKQAQLEQSLAFYDLRQYFQHVVGLSDHYANSKVDNGKKLVAAINAPTDKMMMIGDTTHDFEVAQAIGVDCVLFTGGHQSKERLLSCGTPVVENLTDLLSIIL